MIIVYLLGIKSLAFAVLIYSFHIASKLISDLIWNKKSMRFDKFRTSKFLSQSTPQRRSRTFASIYVQNLYLWLNERRADPVSEYNHNQPIFQTKPNKITISVMCFDASYHSLRGRRPHFLRAAKKITIWRTAKNMTSQQKLVLL